MLNPEIVFSQLKELSVNFFTGVPDSLLKSFCSVVTEKCSSDHIIAANEGNSIALAAGHHLSTGEIPLVYMQNSGLGNCVNPLSSLTHKDVYAIPMLLMIGWRGEPGVQDEPQHVKMGKITLPILDILDIPYFILDKNTEDTKDLLTQAVQKARTLESPVAIVVREGTFSAYKEPKIKSSLPLSRERACEILINNLDNRKHLIISTTGKLSRELYELRETHDQLTDDFYNVGSMGHVSQIALSIALNKPETKVCCFDGDGAVLMHMGSMAIIASLKPKNFIHFLFNNAAHESVGGQKTVSDKINFSEIANGLGYSYYFKAETENEILEILPKLTKQEGPILFEILINLYSRTNLGRPKTTPYENKVSFIKKIQDASRNSTTARS